MLCKCEKLKVLLKCFLSSKIKFLISVSDNSKTDIVSCFGRLTFCRYVPLLHRLNVSKLSFISSNEIGQLSAFAKHWELIDFFSSLSCSYLPMEHPETL